MPLEFPENSKELTQRSKTDFRNEVPESNPFLRNSWVAAAITALSKRVFDLYLTLQQAILQAFPLTANIEYLENLHAPTWGVQRNPAVGSTGTVVATGTLATAIPAATAFNSSDGQEYVSTAPAAIAALNIDILSLVRSGSTVTAVTDGPHNLVSTVPVTIAGAVETEYNGVQEITPVSDDTFVYEIETTPTTPATGTIAAAWEAGEIPVQSSDFGAATLQEPDAELTFVTAIPNINAMVTVTQAGLEGGTDLESPEDFRTRVLARINRPVAGFNVGQIDFLARQVPGVTRVWIFTATPAAGQAEIYFVRDNDVNIIPDAIDVQNVEDKIYSVLPVDLEESDIAISGPTPVVVDFAFSAIVPNTETMKTAISQSLEQFFQDFSDVNEDILEQQYLAAITNTIDTETGDTLQSFTLSSPSGAIFIVSGELAVFGEATFV